MVYILYIFKGILKSMRKLKRNGFTLIEALLALFITSLVSLLGCMLMRCALQFAHMDVDTQKRIGTVK